MRRELESVILYKARADGAGRQLAKTHRTPANPTFLVFRPDGELVAKWSGYEKESFMSRLRQARASKA